MALFRIVMTRTHTSADGYRCSSQVPTFLLECFSLEDARELAIATAIPVEQRATFEAHGGIVDVETLDYLGF